MHRLNLESICEFVLDGTHSSPQRTEQGIPVLSAQNVNNGRLTWQTDRFTTEHEYQVFRKRLEIKKGDLLLTIVGSIGRAAVFEETRPVVFQRSVAVLRPKGGLLCSRFLYHITQSDEFQFQLQRSINQSSQAGVYLGKLKQIVIPVPPLPEQRRIAAILDQADALRAKRREAVIRSNLLVSSIFIQMFGHPYTSKQWPINKLGVLGKLDRGISKHRPRNAPELLGGPYPLVQTGDIANCDGYVKSYQSSYSEVGLKQSRIWSAGTLCITIAANIAKTGILTFDACFPDSVVGFLPYEKVNNEYIHAWFSFIQAKLESTAPEVAQKTSIWESCESLMFPCLQNHYKQLSLHGCNT